MANSLPLQSPRIPLHRAMLYFVLLVPTTVSFTDAVFLQWSMSRPREWQWLMATYFWFALQTAGIAWWVGRQLRTSSCWWGMLGWTMILINMQVFAASASADHWSSAKMLGFAFASGQAGLAVVGSLLGSGSWRWRLPLGMVGFAWTILFGGLLRHGGLMLLVICQCVATALFCVAMRMAGFRIGYQEVVQSALDAGRRISQFSIRHLFYWMTSVAVLTALWRVLGFTDVLLYRGWGVIPILLSATIVLTLVSVVAAWTALGPERWHWRVGMGLVILPILGAVQGFAHHYMSDTAGWPTYLFFPIWLSPRESMFLWCTWTTLAGLFLAGILLVFRAEGQRMYRHQAKGLSPG